MADLESNVEGISETLSTLLATSEQAQNDLSQSNSQLTASAEQIESSLAEVIERIQEIVEQVDEAKDALKSDTEEVLTALEAVNDDLDSAQEELEQEFVEFQETLSGLEAELETLGQEVATSISALHENVNSFTESISEAEQNLQQVILETQDYLSDELTSGLHSHQEEVDQRTTALQSFITDECISIITDKATEFTQHLDQVIEKLTFKVQEVGDRVDREAQTTLEQTSDEIQNKIFGDLLRTADDLEQFAHRLSQVINTTGTTMATSKDALVAGMSTTNVGVNSVIGIFRELQEFLERVS